MLNSENAFITSSLDILSLLNRIHKSRQLISITFDALPQHCLTSLLEVNHDSKILVFDEPNPAISSKLIATKKTAKFSLKLEQLDINFSTRLSGSDNMNLCTSFPEKIFYPQNRQYYRFKTESIDDINITIFFSATRKLECQLLNISLAGLCIRIPYSFASIFNKYQMLDDIYIQLPNGENFSVSATIQNARIEKSFSSIAVGLKINQQLARNEKTIQQFIFRAENS